MSGHAITEEENTVEFDILSEIKESEKKAEGIMERAQKEKDSIVHEANINSSKLISSKADEIKKLQEKKLVDFRERSKLLAEEKIAEGKVTSKQIKAKSEKNIPKAVELVMKRFEEMI